MNLMITGHHFELTNQNKGFITYKVQSKLQHFEDRLHKVSVVVTQEKHLVKSECNITSDFGEFFASATEEHFEKSVETMLARINVEIKKKHDKVVTH